MKSILKKSFTKDAVLALEGVQRKFQNWRQESSLPRRIPEGLWQEVENLVGQGLSINCIAKTLKLDYNHIKRRSLNIKPVKNGLVEIPFPVMFSQPSSFPLAEIVSPNGAVLRIFSPESSSIIKAFLGR